MPVKIVPRLLGRGGVPPLDDALIYLPTNHQQTRYNLQSGWLPTDHGPDEKMVLSRCLAALLLPPGQLAPQVSLRPAITQIK